MFRLRKLSSALWPALICSSALHAQQQPVPRCTAGSLRWEAKAAKFKVVLDSSNTPGECRLSVLRGNKELFAAQAKTIDVHAVGLDLNRDNLPDLAFQTGPSGDCCWTLNLLSLEERPRRIAEISNRFPFVRRDPVGHGAPEFSTQDGAFFGFDGLTAEDLADLPSLVIQWDGAESVDVTSRYRLEYEQAASKAESQLTPERIDAFRGSDGKLEGLGPERQSLGTTKGQVLGIILSYLYTGVEGQAWSRLEQFWPASDVPRIRKLLNETLQTGLQSRLFHRPIAVNVNCPAPPDEPFYRVGNGVAAPRGVYMRDPEYSEQARAEKYQGTVVLWMVISSTGCVSKVQVDRALGLGLNEKAIEAVRSRKFEPARQRRRPKEPLDPSFMPSSLRPLVSLMPWSSVSGVRRFLWICILSGLS